MGLLKSLKSACLGATLAGCVAVSDYPIEKFSPLYFSNSPYVEVTGYHGSLDSKRKLIHLKQMHFVPIGPDVKNTRKLYSNINKVQREIYFLLKDLKRDGVDEIWVEGLDDSPFELFDPKERYSAVMSYLFRSDLFTGEIASGNLDSFKFVPGAELLLGMTGDYNLIPAENFLTHQKALLSVKTGCGKYENVFKAREDYLVSKILASGKDYAFFTFGAGHNFVDNVALWNLRNSDKQVSIIELTPKSLVDILKNN